jgi:hypothetical protein
MDAVRRDAVAPPAIPFPWMRALPALASLGVALAATVGGSVLYGAWRSDTALEPIVEHVALAKGEVGWIAAAVMLTAASLAWSWRVSRR